MRLHTPFAWRNLTHRRVRTLVAVSGVSFSVLLIFMQIGFYFSVLESATAIYRALDADLFITPAQYVFLGQTGVFPRRRLYQAAAIAGVRDASPMYADIQMWRNPEDRLRHPILVLGLDSPGRLMDLPGIPAFLDDGDLLIDSLTRPFFGPQNTGLVTEIGERRVRIAGHYRIGPGFAADGAVIASAETFVRMFKHRSIDDASIGIIRLAPGASAEHVAAELAPLLEPDSKVFTRQQMLAREEDYWSSQTSVGPVFASGAAMGLLIGIVILYQVMATDIANHLKEFATLKALGYTTGRLRLMVVKEASVFALAGFVSGWIFAAVLYRLVRDETGLPMFMPPTRWASILVVTLLMCWFAGILAARKLHRADPAELF